MLSFACKRQYKNMMKSFFSSKIRMESNILIHFTYNSEQTFENIFILLFL